jgi:mitogen-activated protein kinase 15
LAAVCHTGGLLHRDLKPSNLLLNEECVLKVADFGLARCLKDIQSMDEPASVLTDYVATRWYRAPEILLGSTSYGKGVDVWALGCIIAEMFLGKPLLPGTSTVDQLKQIIELTGLPEGNADVIMKSKFATKMLEQFKEPVGSKTHRVKILTTRLTDGGCPADAIDLIADMLNVDPACRPTVGESLKHPWLQAFKEKRKEEDDISEVLEIDLDDDTKSEVHVYRDALYNKLRSYRKTEDKQKKRLFFFGRGSNSARQ